MPATCAHGACPQIVNHYCDIIPKNCAWVLLPRVHQFTDINDKTRRNDSMTFSSGEKLTLMIMCGAALALAACGQAGADRTTVKQDTRHAKSLTMMSFNIRAGRGLEGDGNIPEGELGHLPQCAEVIKAAEIACLNLAGRERPVFFAGDFNALPESSTLATLKKTFTILSDPSKPTFRSDRPSQCIDYIMVDSVHADDVTVVSRDVIAAPQATDHCALVVRAEVARPQRSTNHIHQP